MQSEHDLTSRTIHLVRRPAGMPRPEDFALVDVRLPEPREGEVLVENLYLSIDPVIRIRLDADVALDGPIPGIALGRVLASLAQGFTAGDIVFSRLGMRERFVSGAEALTRIDPDRDLPLTLYIDALGPTGFTAYGGMRAIARIQPGERVLVSGAGGAVGSIAAQIARLTGCEVVAITGDPEKVAWLRDEAGVATVIDYKREPLEAALARTAGDGFDVYFDNVGGNQLDAALRHMKTGGRVALCGMVSTYNGEGAPITGLIYAIHRRLTLRGFSAADYPDLHDRFREEMAGWLKQDAVRYRQTVLHGIAAAPEGLIGVLQGANRGKMLIALDAAKA